jgi:hypothetical protein
VGAPTPREPATDARGAASRDRRSGALRIVTAIAAALAFALGVYALLQAARPASGLVSFSFLLILPATVSAFVAYVADPWGERRLSRYRRLSCRAYRTRPHKSGPGDELPDENAGERLLCAVGRTLPRQSRKQPAGGDQAAR